MIPVRVFVRREDLRLDPERSNSEFYSLTNRGIYLTILTLSREKYEGMAVRAEACQSHDLSEVQQSHVTRIVQLLDAAAAICASWSLLVLRALQGDSHFSQSALSCE